MDCRYTAATIALYSVETIHRARERRLHVTELVLCTSDDGRTRLDLRVDGQTVWLTQLEIAELFQTTKQNVSLHAKNIFKDGELAEAAVVKDSLTTAADGKRYQTKLYNLDLILAKNYLTEDEVDTLNRLVVIFLEQAELRAKQQQDLTLDYWRTHVDRMLTSNDRPLLDGPASISHKVMKTIAAERYETFDTRRRADEARAADADDLKAVESLEKDLKRKGGRK